MSKVDIKDASKYIQDRWDGLKSSYKKKTGNSLILTCVYRSPEEQLKLFKIGRDIPGRIVTNCDGIKKKSNHNYFPSKAVDVAVIKNGKLIWDEHLYAPLGDICAEFGLVWGGNWKGFKDMPHIEVPK